MFKMSHSEVEPSENPFLPASLVAVKPPQFSPEFVQGWIANMEAQFHLAKITTDHTKFYHAVAALPPHVTSRLSPTVMNEHKYSTLKVALEKLFTRSK